MKTLHGLQEIRPQHFRHQSRYRENPDSIRQPSFRREIEEFIAIASRAGEYLVESDDRDYAQSIIDYWTAALISAGLEESSGFRGASLHPPKSEASSQVDSSAASEARAAKETIRTLDSWVEKCGDSDRHRLRQLLLKVTRINPANSAAYSVPLVPDVASVPLADGSDPLSRAIDVGLVRKVTEGPAAGSFYIAHESFLTDWRFYREVILELRRFRSMARLWCEKGQAEAFLITDPSFLADMGGLPELLPEEQAFVVASQAFIARQTANELENTRREKRRLGITVAVLSLLLALLASAVIYAFNQAEIARKALAEQKKATEQRDMVIKELELALSAKDEALKRAESAIQVADKIKEGIETPKEKVEAEKTLRELDAAVKRIQNFQFKKTFRF